MNVQETAAVIAYFGAAFPTFDPSDDTVDVWVAEVGDIDPADAGDAMRHLVRTCDFPPTIAKFRMACKEIGLRRRQGRYQALEMARHPWPDELVEEIKRMSSTAAKRKHWHGGPNPCPVCGGMKPAERVAAGADR